MAFTCKPVVAGMPKKDGSFYVEDISEESTPILDKFLNDAGHQVTVTEHASILADAGKMAEFDALVFNTRRENASGHEDLKWDPNETEKPWIEGPFFEEARRIFIEVETERLGENLAAFGRLRVKPTTRLGWEEDA